MRFSAGVYATASILAISWAGAANAQAGPAPAATATQVGEVIVTAQRRAQNLQRVPAAITALTTETLQQRGITQTGDLRFAVPSLQVGTIYGGTNVTIRGIGNVNVSINASPAVSVNLDGVYQPIAAMGDFEQVDLARIEVLRGPQGTLYGRNSTAGAINFITNAPTDKFEGYVLGSYATYDESRLQGMINVPINDRLRVRGVVDWDDQRDGFVKNVIPGGEDVDAADRISGRLRISADLTDTLKLDLEGVEQHSSGPQNYLVMFEPPGPAGIAANPYLANAIVPTAPWRTSVTQPPTSSRDYTSLSGTLSWQLGDFNLKSISAFQQARDDYHFEASGTNLSIFPQHSGDKDKTFTQEVDLSGKVGPVTGVVGAFYLDETYDSLLNFDFILGYNPLPPGSMLSNYQTPLKTTAVGFYGDATWSLTDRLRLIGGIRYSRDQLTDTQFGNLSFSPTFVITTCPLQTNEVVFDSVTPRAGLQYDISSSSNVYGTFAEGFKDGGFNPNSCNQTFKPEKITDYEIGMKNRFFDGHATLNLSAFYYDYTNLQVVEVVGLTQQTTNAAAARVLGAEAEGLWQPDEHWTVNANLSLIRATYTSFVNTDDLDVAAGPQNLSGNTLDDAPREILNLGVAYRTSDLGYGNLTLRGDVSQRTKIYFREYNLPLDSQRGFTTLNLALIWDSPDRRYQARLFATNVTDVAYKQALFSSDGVDTREGTWGNPRQVGIELRAKF